ncbi:ATP-binding protein [Streptomyces sp. NPDC059917]|uniref:ATP-binding protein n=1 Tax=Streptomyces sp. NPDC059917 TaxID=3347002 RepID=UPI00365AB723
MTRLPASASASASAGEELVWETRFHAADLGKLRLRIDGLALDAGLPRPRRDAFVLAVHEVTCNAVRHGGGSGTLRLYRGPDALRCQVTDEGPGFAPGSVPHALPDPGSAEGGRGLWLVREFTDGMEIAGGDTGAEVTCVMRLADR